MYEYNARLERVVDGDTIDTTIDLGFRMFTEQRIRLSHINTPEIWHQPKDSDEYKKGMEAKDYVTRRFNENNNTFVVKTEKDPGVYGRFLGTVFLADSPESLNDELLRKGYAERYK